MNVLAPIIRRILQPVVMRLDDIPVMFAANDPVMDLFANNEQGVYYDIQDLSTLYQDAAGTTPAVLEQPVGLILDKRKGLVEGTEKIANGTFDTDITGWANVGTNPASSATWVAPGAMRILNPDSNGSVRVQYAAALTAGQWYKAVFTLSNFAVGSIQFMTSGTTILQTGTAGTYTVIFKAEATDIAFLRNFPVDVRVDNLSIKSIAGNHAFQNTTASKPKLSARKNTALNTDYAGGLSDAPTNSNASAVTGLTGGMPHSTGIHLNSTAGAAYAYAGATWSVLASTTYRISAFIQMDDGLAPTPEQTRLVVGNQLGLADSIEHIEGATYRVSATITSTTSNLGNTGLSSSVGWRPYTFTGLQLEQQATTSRYQWVDTATNYDSEGFPHYLQFDGFDDVLQTATLNFTSTDAISVFAGVQPTTVTSTGVVAELGSFSDTGMFSLRVPYGASVGAGFYSKQTIATLANGDPLVPRKRLVLAAQADISSDLVSLRENGVQVEQTIADQGIGNYGNYVLSIGRRAALSDPFSGRVFELIVRGATTPSLDTQKVENKINNYLEAY